MDTIKLIYAKVKDMTILPSNRKEYATFLEQNEGKDIRIQRVTGLRTEKQNNSLHLAFSLLAKALNAAGLDMRKVLKQEVMIPWETESVKEYLFKPIIKAMYNKTSTTQLDKVKEIDEAWDVLMRHFGEKHHLEYIEFPHEVKVEEKPIDYPTEELKPTF